MSRRIRVGLTLTQDWHRVPGGTAVAANSLGVELTRSGEVELTGLVPRTGRPTGRFAPPVPTRRLQLGLPWLYDSWHHLRWPRITSSLPEAEIIHLTVPIAPPRERIPLVATVHDVLPLTMPSSFTRRGARMMSRGLERIRSEAAIVMVPTEAGRREFLARGFDPARLVVVPLGVDPPEPVTPAGQHEVLQRHGIEPPYVLFVGTAEPRKGLDVLASAMAMLGRPELTLVLVGPQGWGDVDLVGVARVARLGHVPDRDLDALRTGAVVCALPSRAEGFGLPVLEAMAAGTPVVTTSGTPMEEFAHGVARFVPVGDAEVLAGALADIVDDPELARQMGIAGKQRAAEFTWSRTAREVIEVYATVLQ
jgi:glycosyltransferase involved in cell wall biosynthesis